MSNKSIIFNLLIISVFSLFCVVTPSLAGSGSLGNYVSSGKAKKVHQRRSVGVSSRSSCQKELSANSVELLVPKTKVVHKTSKARPSFFVKSNIAQLMPFKFILVDFQSGKPVVEANLALSQKGIKKIDLPSSLKLKPEKIYLWYVVIPCQNSDDSSQSPFVLYSSVEFNPLSPKMLSQLQNLDSDLEAATFYTKNGFWYEALDLSVHNYSNFLQKLLLSFNFQE